MTAASCAVLCMLALSLDFKPSADIQKCSYCAQMRGLSLGCAQKPWVCAEMDPDSLIYCLSRDERPWGRDSLKRSTRCISHANLLNQSLPMTGELLDALSAISPPDRQYCSFEDAQQCQCPDCIAEGEMGKPVVELEVTDEGPPVDLATELQNIALLLDKLIVDENQQQKVESVTRKTTRRTLPPKLAAASAPLRPLPPIPHNSEESQRRMIPFSMDFLHSGGSASSHLLINLYFFWPIHFLLILYLI